MSLPFLVAKLLVNFVVGHIISLAGKVNFRFRNIEYDNLSIGGFDEKFEILFDFSYYLNYLEGKSICKSQIIVTFKVCFDN